MLHEDGDKMLKKTEFSEVCNMFPFLLGNPLPPVVEEYIMTSLGVEGKAEQLDG